MGLISESNATGASRPPAAVTGGATAGHPAPGTTDRPAALRVAYLVNQYPKVSHSFIRREILAMERLGVHVERIALRGWDAEVIDEQDRAEVARTRYLLQQGIGPLLLASVQVALATPRRFLGALAAAIGMYRRSDRPLVYHLAYLAQACRAVGWLRASRIDHLHAHFGTNSTDVAVLTHLLGGPEFSFTVHGADESDRGQFLNLARKVEAAKFVAAISSYTRAQLLRRCAPRHWPRVRVIHCGLEPSSFARPSDPPARGMQLLCVGRLSEEKGQLVLLESLARVVARWPDCRLVLAGDGPLRPAIEQRSRELGIDRHIEITGWVSGQKVRELLLGARCLVVPSLQEGLPVVIMEAMALKRPVIATYVAGIPELLQPPGSGWLVPAGHVGALEAAISACLEASDGALKTMGEHAFERVSVRHAIDAEAGKLAALFASSKVGGTLEDWHADTGSCGRGARVDAARHDDRSSGVPVQTVGS